MQSIKSHLIILLIIIHSLFARPNEPGGVIRFAWFSDAHVGSSTGAADLGIVVQDVREQQDVDFVIVSGDISEMDVGNNLQLAKTILDSLGLPYHIIPGNHDTKWSDSGAEGFTQLWGADRFNFEVGEFRFIGIHQGPVMRMADGYIDPADIAWVRQILETLPDPRQKIFIVLHYPLDPAVNNWYALRDVIRPYNIQAILHGHGHGNRAIFYEGVPGIMSRSTLRRGKQPTGYTLVKLTADQAEFSERIPETDSLHVWHQMDLGERDFSDSLKLPLPDYSANAASGVDLVWQVETGAIITGSPTIAGKQVIAANTQGKVFAVDLTTGTTRWSWQGQGAIHGTPAVGKGRLVIGFTDASISCLDLEDGELLWQQKTSGAVLGSPNIDKRRVYIGSGDGYFRALNLKTGKLDWEFGPIEGYIETRPTMAKDLVLFGAWDGAFYGLDTRRGNLRWRWQDGPKGLLYSPAACWPVVSHNKVFIVAPDRVMSAIDLKTGTTLWRKSGHRVRETIGISEDGERVFARTMQDTTLAVKAAANAFELDWIQPTGFGYDIAPNAMVEADGRLFFSTRDGWVYCLDSVNGQTLWKYRLSDGLVNAVAIVSPAELVCTAADGRISYLKLQSQ